MEAKDRDIKKRIPPELLAPVGRPEVLEAAIEAGADAVYFGAGDFNARMRAKNFTEGELEAALKLCSQYGVKSYITVNTRLRDGELSSVLDLAEKLYAGGADALIVADLGAAKTLRERFPDFELHASTQVSGHSLYDAKCLYEMGFSRMVCPREMSYEEICSLVKGSPIEIEMFIHGAHCVSFSGQCMMSYAMGGRSGNRGMCAQPCRLPFHIDGVKNRYPLSLKDMSLAASVPALIESGVSSLKIEGRQKSAEYVYGAVSVYRRLLDEGRGASPDEISYLSELFSRDGFTDGYFKHRYTSMLGIRRNEDVLSEKEGGEHKLKRKLPLDAVLTLKTGERAELFVTDGKREAVAYGEEVVLQEDKRPLDKEAAEKNMSRLGGTAFELSSFEFISDGGFFTLSAVNRLRREALEKLCVKERRPLPYDKDKAFTDKAAWAKNENSTLSPAPKGERRKLYTAEFLSLSQVTDKAKKYFDIIYIPIGEINEASGGNFAPVLPPLTFDKERDGVFSEMKRYSEKCGCEGKSCEILVHGLGQAALAREAGLRPVFSYRINVTNSKAARAVLEYGENVCISPEAALGLLKDTGKDSSVVVYGKIPLMHTQRCMLSDGGSLCRASGSGGRTYPHRKKKQTEGRVSCDGKCCFGKLSDRKNTQFTVVGLPDCTNIIYNSVPIYMGDKMKVFDAYRAERLHFIFSDENGAECDRVIEAYKKGKVPSEAESIRRLK